VAAPPAREPKQKSVVLILARELASNIATPMFIVDDEGTLVFYNEPAERIVGAPFAQLGEMPASEWGAMLKPEDLQGNKLSRTKIAPGVALLERRPEHHAIQITGLDGAKRRLSITAYPLFARADEFVGAVAIFWEHDQERTG
jgi:PAS domain-containing protein